MVVAAGTRHPERVQRSIAANGWLSRSHPGRPRPNRLQSDRRHLQSVSVRGRGGILRRASGRHPAFAAAQSAARRVRSSGSPSARGSSPQTPPQPTPSMATPEHTDFLRAIGGGGDQEWGAEGEQRYGHPHGVHWGLATGRGRCRRAGRRNTAVPMKAGQCARNAGDCLVVSAGFELPAKTASLYLSVARRLEAGEAIDGREPAASWGDRARD
jgi:hypothetical protein